MFVRLARMRFAVRFSVCVGFATTSLLNGAQFSETHELPPLKLAASELDAILSRTHSLVDAANGSAGQGSTREAVKLVIDGHEIELPHFSVASSLAFPNEIFAFSYTYFQSDKPISSVVIDLGDAARRISVSGESADRVEALTNLLEKDLHKYRTAMGGRKFRRVAGVCLLMLFLTSLMASGAYCAMTKRYSALGIPICSALGVILVLLLPWNRLIPGFALYQRYSPFFLIRHAPEVALLALLAALAGIPLSYFLSRRQMTA